MDDFYHLLKDSGFPAAWDSLFNGWEFSWGFLLLSLAAPVLVILSRNEARIRRLKNLQDFIEAYPSSPDTGDTSQDARDPSLEFVKSKYMADAYVPRKYQADFEKGSSREKIQLLIRHGRMFGNPGDFKLLFSSSGFVAISYLGFANLYEVLQLGLRSGASPAFPSLPCGQIVNERQLQVIAALAFTGAYITAARIFLRGLATFDLSAYTFLRQSVEVFASVILIVFAYKAAPHPFQSIENMLTDSTSATVCTEIPWYWYALAPVLALLPESSSNFLLTRVQRIVSWIKQDDDRFTAATRIIPLDVIEGIDYFIRFRLEECGIHEVQNLATFNPIMLSVETPYGIYQTVDWIGQAQLCHIVGLDRFLLLREMHIRTIFDLERAIDFTPWTGGPASPGEAPDPGPGDDGGGQQTPPPGGDTPASAQPAPNGANPQAGAKAKKSPPQFDFIYAGILFAPTNTMREIATISGVSPLRMEGGSFIGGTVDDYCVWARHYIGSDVDATSLCIEHLMAWISDDLHVRRLRRIWQEMTDNLGARSERLANPKATRKQPG